MKKRLTIFLCVLFMCVNAMTVYSFDLWQYPEMADKHSIFLGVFPASFSMLYDNYFQFVPELNLDYMLPFGFPLSLGAAARVFTGDLFTAGLRPGYHINLNDENTDIYALFTTDIVFKNESIILEYGGRVGVRRRFGRFFCIQVESGHKFQSLNMGFSIKLN